MINTAIVADAIVDLCHFTFKDGVSFGCGTAAELDALKAEGTVPADAFAQPMTLQEAMELLA